jgi:hypothetical protein
MLREGFRYMTHQKGVYVDGHERPDVVEYRQKVFIPAIRSYQPRIIEYEVGNRTQEAAKVSTNKRPIAILFHDESTFQAHDAQEVLGLGLTVPTLEERGWPRHTSL